MTLYTLALDSPDADLATVGGKGASLSRLARGGLPVPPGCHITTTAYRRFVAANDLQAHVMALAASAHPDDPASLDAASAAIQALFTAAPIPDDVAEAVRAAYTALTADHRPLTASDGRGMPRPYDRPLPVAVRSSATAEDLPDASFAGQQDTYLNIQGADAVLDAVRRCWASLWTARALGYRARHAIAPDSVALAVVVQALVAADAAGILFTANPVTGHRGQAVIDAAWGLGEAVVGGQVTPDHWVVDKASGRVVSRDIGDKAVMTVRTADGTAEVPTPAEQRRQSVLSEDQAVDLARVAARIEALYGLPQDIEWALADGRLAILQSRPITSLFPQPPYLPADGALRVYLDVNYMQGLVEPLTPAGISTFRDLARGVQRASGTTLVSETGPAVYTPVAGRIFVDITTPLRSPRARRLLGGILALMDPQMMGAVEQVLADPRLTPTPDAPLPVTLWRRFRFLLPVARAILPRAARLWRDPDGARQAYLAEVNGEMAAFHAHVASAQTLAERVARLDHLAPTAGRVFPRLAAMAFSGIATQRLAHGWVTRWLGDETAVLDLLRGVPHNPTTQMDLTLWTLSRAIAADPASAEALREPTAAVVDRYRAGTLPPTAQAALGTFLAVYGHRAVREIDLGMPRWADEPGYIVGVLRTYLDIHDPALAPDVHFREGDRAARARAAALLDRVARTPGGWRRRAALAVILGRLRALMGLREVPKFYIIRVLAEVRAVWRAIGQDLVALGLLDAAEDVFFLTGDELRSAAQGSRERLAERAAQRRADYQAELRRRRVPRLITSEGVEVYGGVAAHGAASLQGTGASPGVATGVARVILDPHGAQLQPGEILVAPSTDPAWTPLFLAAGGLVMEAGGVMSHGSVVAREYGIPAVVGVADATHRLRTGQRVTVDGTRGQVTVN